MKKKWIIIDKDDWSKEEINSVMHQARSKDICVGISNECYELWLLLHFEKVTRSTSRMEINAKLNSYFKKYFSAEYSKSAQDTYRYLIGFQKEAIKNAEYLIKMHKNNHGRINPTENNPITFIYELVKCLNSIYDEKQICECFDINS